MSGREDEERDAGGGGADLDEITNARTLGVSLVLHRLSTRQYCLLVKSYVEAINKGAIPSIENSWAYICKNECLKALD